MGFTILLVLCGRNMYSDLSIYLWCWRMFFVLSSCDDKGIRLRSNDIVTIIPTDKIFNGILLYQWNSIIDFISGSRVSPYGVLVMKTIYLFYLMVTIKLPNSTYQVNLASSSLQIHFIVCPRSPAITELPKHDWISVYLIIRKLTSIEVCTCLWIYLAKSLLHYLFCNTCNIFNSIE